jgi:hypothetical protein
VRRRPACRPFRRGFQAWERQVDRLHDLIAGSPRERAAGDLVLYHRNEDPVTSCMRAKGIDYSPAPWADGWRLRDSRGLGAGSSLFLEPIDDPDLLVRAERGEALAQRGTGRGERGADRAYDSLGPAAKARWDAAIKACQHGRQESTEGWHPAAGYQTLLNAFDRLLVRGGGAPRPRLRSLHARGRRRRRQRLGAAGCAHPELPAGAGSGGGPGRPVVPEVGRTRAPRDGGGRALSPGGVPRRLARAGAPDRALGAGPRRRDRGAARALGGDGGDGRG